jgi:UDP-N-acetylmuramate dehydrogenase
MKSVLKIKNILDKIEGKISFNENLSKLSWFNIGGPAQVLFRPKNLRDLSLFLKTIDKEEKIKILGAGSNTLIREGGFEGIVIKLGNSFSNISLFDDRTIIAGASALDKTVSNFALENSISDFEFLSCIPGTIGGAIRMNTGCYNEDISKIVVSIQVMDFTGKMRVIYSNDIKFSYRGCNLSEDLIFISATLKGKESNKANIKKKMDKFIVQKKKSQPEKIKTCGSTFKNPENNKAWKLIKESGCAGMREGDAYISEKHCNFFVNKGNASSNDIEHLITKVKKKVLEKTGISLDLEVKIIGKKI